MRVRVPGNTIKESRHWVRLSVANLQELLDFNLKEISEIAVMTALSKWRGHQLSQCFSEKTTSGSPGFIFEIQVLHVGGGPACVIRWVSECECLEERGNEGRKIETKIQTVCGVSGLFLCTHVVGWHVFSVSEPLCLGPCWFVLCLGVCVRSCVFIQPACLLPLLTWPLLFSCQPDRQYARAPPQSFIGSYCHLTQIPYASIDCVEMQSGSPQQRSKQSKFNKTPPPAFSPALIAPPKEE